MAPSAILPDIVDVVQPKKDYLDLPFESRKRLEKAGIDLSGGHPYRAARPLYLQDVQRTQDNYREHVDPGTRAERGRIHPSPLFRGCGGNYRFNHPYWNVAGAG